MCKSKSETISGSEALCPGYLAEASSPGDGLKVVINLTQVAVDDIVQTMRITMDIAHPHLYTPRKLRRLSKW